MTDFAQDIFTYVGDAAAPIFTVQDQNGAPINISSIVGIAWSAYRTTTSAAALTKALGSGVTLVGGGTGGQFQVTIAPADTTGLLGIYLHKAVLTDSLGNNSTVSLGQMTVGPAPSWTYDPTQLGAQMGTGNPLMQVRRLIGDTKYDDKQLWDEEINFSLGQRGYVPGTASTGVIYGAAADCCRDLAAEMSRQVDLVQGELKQNYSNRAKAYLSMAAQYTIIASARGVGVPYAGGISISDKQSQETNADRVSPNFTIGMTDNLILGGGAGPQTETLDWGAGEDDELPDF